MISSEVKSESDEALAPAERAVNGKEGRVQSFNGETMRYSIAVDAGEDDVLEKLPMSVNVKPANVRELKLQEVDDDPEDAGEGRPPEGDIPNGSSVTVHGLQSEAARALNGMSGCVLSFNADKGRYDVDLEGQVKAIKFENLRVADVSLD